MRNIIGVKKYRKGRKRLRKIYMFDFIWLDVYLFGLSALYKCIQMRIQYTNVTITNVFYMTIAKEQMERYKIILKIVNNTSNNEM